MGIIAQAFGILGMAANISSYQFKKPQHIMLCQLLGGVLFAANMFMLGAAMGCIINVISIFRALVYIQANRKSWNTRYWNWGFMLVYLVSYVLTFTVFQKEPSAVNILTELLPLIGAVVVTISFSKGDARIIRLCSLINSPCWFTYNCINLSIGGILSEMISLVSAITAFWRLDVKSRHKPQENSPF